MRIETIGRLGVWNPFFNIWSAARVVCAPVHYWLVSLRCSCHVKEVKTRSEPTPLMPPAYRIMITYVHFLDSLCFTLGCPKFAWDTVRASTSFMTWALTSIIQATTCYILPLSIHHEKIRWAFCQCTCVCAYAFTGALVVFLNVTWIISHDVSGQRCWTAVRQILPSRRCCHTVSFVVNRSFSPFRPFAA